MPHHASGSLDNSGCKRLRISSLVDMPEEENNAIEDISEICVLYASGISLLEEMSIRCIATEHWSNMLKAAFDAKAVGTLNTVIRLLRETCRPPWRSSGCGPECSCPCLRPPGELGSSRASTSSFVRPCPFGFIVLIAATYQASSLRQADVRLLDNFTAFTYHGKFRGNCEQRFEPPGCVSTHSARRTLRVGCAGTVFLI